MLAQLWELNEMRFLVGKVYESELLLLKITLASRVLRWKCCILELICD